MEAALPRFRASDAGGSTVLLRADNSIPVAGTLFWLDLSRYEAVLSLLDGWNHPLSSRVLCEALSAEDSCPVKCWAYVGSPA